MGSDLPKQFIDIVGKPILMHTLEALHRIDPSMQLVLVLPKDQFGYWEELVEKHRFTVPFQLCEGGATRFLSVASGLKEVAGNLVGVHDGVRPFVESPMVNACFEAARVNGAAVPVVPMVQSLRKVEGSESRSVNREMYRAVQTPQCFRTDILKNAFAHAAGTDYSDDATVVEAFGQRVELVEGDLMNIKITSPMDLQLAELIATRRTLSQ
jgi:2-C-methyl-D-erythritol 4-phosphate cytidylyltransferase